MANDKKLGFNISSFVKGSPDEKDMSVMNAEIVEPAVLATPASSKPKRASRKPKFDSDNPNAPVANSAQNSMSYLQQNIPYEVAFRGTNEQLDETIAQLNSLGMDTMGDLQMLRGNKTLKNKYMTLGALTEQAVAIINAKLSAIKEKNKVIDDINNLELKRLKDLKLDSQQQDADARIADLYSAFINTPIGTMAGGMNAALGPSQQSMMLVGQDPNVMMPRGIISQSDGDPDMAHAQWQANLDPVQQRMLLQAKGVMDVYVIYDQATGSRRYAAINKQTGQELQGVELPDPDSVWSLNLNLNTCIAKDTNRGVSYPVMIVNNGTPGSMDQF